MNQKCRNCMEKGNGSEEWRCSLVRFSLCFRFGSNPFLSNPFFSNHTSQNLGIHERVRDTNLPKTARHGWFQRIPIVSHSTARRFVKAFARRDVPLHGNSRLTNASSNWNSTSIVLSSSLFDGFWPISSNTLLKRSIFVSSCYNTASLWHCINIV